MVVQRRFNNYFEEVFANVQLRPEARFKAKYLLEGLCKYETIITAQIFLRIFGKTPLSLYLQTKGIYFLNHMQWYKKRLIV